MKSDPEVRRWKNEELSKSAPLLYTEGQKLGDQPAEYLDCSAPFSSNYEKLSCEQIAEGIKQDLDELIARAYHLSTDRWTSPPHSLDQFQQSETRVKLDREIREEVAQELSATDENARAAAKELHEKCLADDGRKAAEAAVRLVIVGHDVAEALEALQTCRENFMKGIARRFSSWPVSVALESPDKNGVRAIVGIRALAKSMETLELGLCPSFPRRKEVGTVSPFHNAAHEMHQRLCLQKNDPRLLLPFDEEQSKQRKQPIRRSRTPWEEALLQLPVPMTSQNSNDWWAVAKACYEKLWDEKQPRPNNEKKPEDPNKTGPFSILIDKLTWNRVYKGKSAKKREWSRAEKRNRVINVELKSAFFRLVPRQGSGRRD